ncbi:hypothetical protein ACOM2C_15015 [Pseudarthrobacter sp. So.54]
MPSIVTSCCWTSWNFASGRPNCPALDGVLPGDVERRQLLPHALPGHHDA